MRMSRSRRGERVSYWPGFVDAMSSLLLVIIFLLTLFMLAQFFLSQEILGKNTALTRLNSQIAELSDLLQLERANSSDMESTIATLSATLTGTQSERDDALAKLANIGSGISDKNDQITTLNDKLLAERQISSEAAARLGLLNQQLAALRTQIGALEQALQASESRDTSSRTRIADLGRRLNLALAQRVQDLSRYRSDFFGRLRKILADRTDVRIVGDRFVFQSEVLFAPGQADISPKGAQEINKLADALLQLEKEIPPEINWVLRIDGHTDSRPISTVRFPSNWELSAARAIAVAKLLIARGVSPHRLVAAGFGEFSPIDPGNTEEAYRRNRRIEFKLTE
ncbi:MotB-like protein Atu3746 [hydrothermal vent metagenome]|uniref:MotB-like protein Atu3746 n=1 Tax=hydrothermal vent metagenome TaxID=652676 RepID=A0A3B0UFB9_9ZZZZ